MKTRSSQGFAAITTLLLMAALLFGGFAISSKHSKPVPQEAPVASVDATLGATIPVPIALFETSLASSITDTATSMTLVSGTDKDGTSLNGSTYGFIIDEGSSNEEFVLATCTSTACTSMTRGISVRTGNTAVASLQKSHRRGASVKITDAPVLLTLARILNGTETLPNAISYDTGVGPVVGSDLADKEYVLSVVTGGTITADRVIIAGTAGETLSTGNIVYLKSSDTRWYKTDADASSTSENVLLGVAQGSGTSANPVTGGVLIYGLDTNQSGLSTNTKYYISGTAGALSSSAGAKEVSIGLSKSSTSINFTPGFDQKITEDEQDAMAGGSTFGTPSASNKFITEAYQSSASALPVVRTYEPNAAKGSSTTQFDVTNPAGTTFRYTFDGTGTDPLISSGTVPIGSVVDMQAANLTAANKGVFVTTGVGTDYFEVTNASGVAENNKTISSGYFNLGYLWTKPAGLKYIVLELVGAGGAGGNGSGLGNTGGGGGGGGYCRKTIAVATLGATEKISMGIGGTDAAAGNGTSGNSSAFGSHCSATGGAGGTSTANDGNGGLGGIGSGGDINSRGNGGGAGGIDLGSASQLVAGGTGGSSYFGGGAQALESGAAPSGTSYGGGGAGGTAGVGGSGAQGFVTLTEFYN